MNKSVLVIVASVVLAVIGQTLLKMGMTEVGRIGATELSTIGTTVIKVASNPRVVIGLGFYFLSALLYMVALSRIDLSLAYPFVGLSYLIVTLVAWLVLGEDVSALRWTGVAVISLGVFIVSRSV